MVPGRIVCSLVPALHKGEQKRTRMGPYWLLCGDDGRELKGQGWGALDLLEDKAAKAPESCSAAQNIEATGWWQASLHQDRQRYWRKIETFKWLGRPNVQELSTPDWHKPTPGANETVLASENPGQSLAPREVGHLESTHSQRQLHGQRCVNTLYGLSFSPRHRRCSHLTDEANEGMRNPAIYWKLSTNTGPSQTFAAPSITTDRPLKWWLSHSLNTQSLVFRGLGCSLMDMWLAHSAFSYIHYLN